MLIVNGTKYRPITFKNEEKEFHPLVKENSKEIFGKDSLYFDVKHILKTLSGIGSIPDAYVIDPSQRQWYVIENELSTHPVYDHIVVQLTKFSKGVKNTNTRNQIIEMLYDAITQNAENKAVIQKSIGSTDIHYFLTGLIREDPQIVIVIDEKTPEIEEACDGLGFETKIVEFKAFIKEDDPKVHAYYFENISQFETTRERSQGWDTKLASANGELRAIIEELEKRINALGRITTIQRTRKAYYKGKHSPESCFAVFEIADDGLLVRVDANSPNFRDPEKWSIRGIHSIMFFQHGSEFKITSKQQIDYAMSLIGQAYDLTLGKE